MKNIKTLGKVYFKKNISFEYHIFQKLLMLIRELFGIFIFFILTYGLYLDMDNYFMLVTALLFSLSFFSMYDTYNKLVYKTQLIIGDKGFSIIKVYRKNNKQKDVKIIYFKDIDELVIKNKFHYSVGGERGYVEHLIVKSNNKIVLDVNPKKINLYDEVKDVLVEQYGIYKIMR